MRWPVILFALAMPATAAAHVALQLPPARYPRDFVKAGPCGHPDNPPGEAVETYEAGQTITVQWDEYIAHPGHFRLALSAEGDGAFVDPTDYDDFYSAPNVLLDDIEDPDGRTIHRLELTLPAEVECEACVLQLIQVMTDKPPWGPEGGNELYYQCADIRIVAPGTLTEAAESSGDDGAAGDDAVDGCGCTESRRRTRGWRWLALGLLVARRRRAGARLTAR